MSVYQCSDCDCMVGLAEIDGEPHLACSPGCHTVEADAETWQLPTAWEVSS